MTSVTSPHWGTGVAVCVEVTGTEVSSVRDSDPSPAGGRLHPRVQSGSVWTQAPTRVGAEALMGGRRELLSVQHQRITHLSTQWYTLMSHERLVALPHPLCQ